MACQTRPVASRAVGKVKRLFVCSSCEHPFAQWSGRCSACGEWGTVGEQAVVPSGHAAGSARRPVATLTLVQDEEEHRIETGLAGVDRVLGGGLVPGSVVLVAGAPGTGKSTLLLQLASRLTGAGHPCLIASGEEARGQIAARARRLGLAGDDLRYTPGRDLADVLATAVAERPSVLVVDSIQTIRDAASDALPGGTGQVRGCADALIGMAKEHGIAVFLVGHVTKDGDVAGPRTLEHAVDAVLTFEGDARSGLRVLAAGKNRYGPEGEVAWFEMTSGGLIESDAGPRVGERDEEPGCASAVVLAGRRAFVADVQALVVPTDGPPKRQVAGLDAKRFHIVAAVTDHAMDLRLTRSELYGTSSGGLRIDDPGADLALAAALASASTGRPLPPGTGFVGELALTGSLRGVPATEARSAAAAAAGVRTLVVPRNGSTPSRSGAVRTLEFGHVRDALRWAFHS